MTLGRIWPSAPATQRPKKFLVNVTVERSLGPIHVLMSPENTAADLIRKVVEAYGKEGRRPLLLVTDPKGFELHYSQYSLDSLDPEEKLVNLGSRNFFLCSKPSYSQILIANSSNHSPKDAAVDIPPSI